MERPKHNQLFLPDEEQDEVANDSLDNDILGTYVDDASPTSDHSNYLTANNL